MTEFEMAYLHVELRNSLANVTSILFGAVSGFLIVSYFAAHRLSRTMCAIAVGAFAIFSLSTIVSIDRTNNSLSGLTRQMREFAVAEKGLTWHQIATMPEWSVGNDGAFAAVFFSLFVVAAIYFFFHCRRVNRIADTPAIAPVPTPSA